MRQSAARFRPNFATRDPFTELRSDRDGRTTVRMKTLHALSFCALFGGVAALSAGFVGCSSSSGSDTPDDTGTPADDSGVDTTPPPTDTNPKDTAVKDTAPFICDKALPDSFACTPVAASEKGTPGTSCSEADLQAMVTACVAPKFGIATGCDAWKTAHPDCATCVGTWALAESVIKGKIYADRDKCLYQQFDADCQTAWKCMFACDDAVCGACDQNPGTSSDGTTSEFQECANRERARGGTVVPKGVCYDKAAGKADTCFAGGSYDTCIVDELFSPTGSGGAPDVPSMQNELVQFYRGACRDNGNWKNAKETCSTPPCAAADAGTDAGDTGTDAASDADAGTADTGTDAATDAADAADAG